MNYEQITQGAVRMALLLCLSSGSAHVRDFPGALSGPVL